MRTPRIAAVVALLALALAASAEDIPAFEWKGVDGASGYLFQVREPGGKILAERETSDTSIALPLAPGAYEIRISALNKFKKPASSSEWKPVSVVRAVPPKVDGFAPSALYAGSPEGKLTLTGSNFLPDTEIFLEGEGKLLRAKTLPGSKDTQIEAAVPLADAAPGTYTVHAANPKGQETVVEAKLEMKRNPRPVLDGIDTPWGYNDRISQGIRVFGEAFEPGIVGKLVKDGNEIAFVSMERVSSEELVIAVDGSGRAPGKYRILLRNPGGLESEAGLYFKLVSPASIELYNTVPNSGNKGTDSKRVTVSGFGFEDGIKVALASVDLVIEPEILETNETSVVFEMPLDRTPEGMYTLRAENPSGLTAYLEDAFMVYPKNPVPPRADSISPEKIKLGTEDAEFVLKGKDFKEGMSIAIRHEEVSILGRVKSVGKETATFSIAAAHAPSGEYSVEMKNPDGGSSTLKSVLSIEAPPRKEYLFSLAAAYRIGLPITDSGSTLGMSFLGASLEARVDIGNDALGTSSLFGVPSLGLILSYDAYQGKGSAQGQSQLAACLALGWRSDWKLPLQASAGIGLGAALAVGSATNLGLGWFASAGAEYSLTDSMAIRAGLELGGFSSSSTLVALRPTLGFVYTMGNAKKQ
jgi:hypothetical protein